MKGVGYIVAEMPDSKGVTLGEAKLVNRNLGYAFARGGKSNDITVARCEDLGPGLLLASSILYPNPRGHGG
jgi:hypothetical protein